VLHRRNQVLLLTTAGLAACYGLVALSHLADPAGLDLIVACAAPVAAASLLALAVGR